MDILNNILKEAAIEPSARAEFYRVLLESTLYVITPDIPEKDENTIIKKGTKFSLINFEDENNELYIPIFSSVEHVKKCINDESGYLAMDSLSLLEILSESRTILNPGSDYAKEFLPQEIKNIIDGSIFTKFSELYVVEKESSVLIGHPKVYPTKLIENLSKLFEKYKSVRRAYLAHYFYPKKDTKPHSLIIVDAPNAPEQLFSDAGITAEASLENGDYVDLMRYNGEGLTQSIVTDFKPFYTRKFLGIISF